MLSAICFNLNQSKILSSGNGLTITLYIVKHFDVGSSFLNFQLKIFMQLVRIWKIGKLISFPQISETSKDAII